ncbi:anaerobic ribonucleoside-triphosphate reductase activating protein [Candidatus Saccharibacteria bacterium]|nr:anaerobic ribonucleoside-triphosphate reductase activating protein [Candidatus Saccharibacteria bacterium]MCL1962951.1 anaerobic ribonucleoside-triphosphate reductase activating protein [Candidatus Saccharibacteria bacterium]MCL1963405.1 anaerobic ribonucleoside-triphosphate reductase activating protein [Candidatus Saccharibacteria bacterium]
MKIGGIQKLSLVDYPGHTAAALFTIGCNMRCGYCHNPELVLPERYIDEIPLEEILDFLKKRVGKIDGMVISGGEPTLHDDLPDFAKTIKSMGYLVKLDSNGTHPAMLKQMIADKSIDYIAMDIKATFPKYSMTIARPVDVGALRESIKIMIESGLGHEFRTTCVRQLMTVDDFDEIGEMVHGAERYAVQRFRAGRSLNPQFDNFTIFSDEEIAEIVKKLEKHVKKVVVH